MAEKKDWTRKQNYRRMLGEELSHRMLAHFKKHGIAAIERVHKENPAEYLRVITRIMPHEVEAEITHSFTQLLEQAALKAQEKVINGEVCTDSHTPAHKSLIHKESHSIDNAVTQDAELVEVKPGGD